MKLPSFIFYGSLLGLVLSVLVGCGQRSHTLKQTTAYIGGDGETNRVVNVEFESGIKIAGQKLDMKDLELTESVGKDGWQYGVGVSSASSSPESVALGFLVDAFKSSQLAQARQNTPAIGDEDMADVRELLNELKAARSRRDEE